MRWNDAKARVEHDPPEHAGVSLRDVPRKAFWITGGAVVAIAIVVAAAAAYRRSPAGPTAFPVSGDVVVSNEIEPGAATAKLILRGDHRDGVVQLLEPQGHEHMMSIYIRAGQKRPIPVPPGTWRLRLIEGDKWYGPERLFDKSTHSWISRNTVRFTKGRSTEVDLAHPDRLAFRREAPQRPGAQVRSAIEGGPTPGQAPVR